VTIDPSVKYEKYYILQQIHSQNEQEKKNAYHVTKLVHAQSEGVFAHRVLKVMQLNFSEVLLPHYSPPALFFLKKRSF